MKKALVLLNMGGPNSLDEVDIFLKNMFNDKNIIATKSDMLRSFIAYLIVNSRAEEARANYAKIGGKSPIIDYTKKLIKKLEKELPDTYVTHAMRYTPPFAKDVVEKLKEKNITNITLLPLYPHYSSTTTKSSLEDFGDVMNSLHVESCLHIERFYKNTLYNDLLIDKIEEQLQGKNSKEFELIFSAHSLPQSIIKKGDPYQKEVLLHVELLKEILDKRGIEFADIHVAYQSKLGPVKWLEPSLEEHLGSLTCKKVIISPLSFTLDNSETEFELSIEYKEVAKQLKYEEYLVAKCPNDSDKFVQAISQIITI